MLPVDCETKDLYQLLGLPAYPAGKTCSASQIKKAYYAMALRHHPDKQSVGADSTAVTDLFQRINFAYSVLSDEQKRLQYDSTGRIGYAGGEEGVVDWLKYFNEVYQKITVEDIKRFEQQYRGSAEEEEDLKQAYRHSKGDMDRILEQVPLCTVDDEDRFRTLLLTAIDRKEIRAYTRFTRPDPQDQIRRRKQADAEAKEAEELAKELGLNEALFQKPTQQQLNKGNKVSDDDEGMAAIKQAIQRRSQDRYETLIAGLEAKYGATKSKSKSTTTTANTNNNNNRQRKK